MIIDPNSPSWRERMEADIQQAIINSGGIVPIQTNPSWKARIEELVKVFTYLVVSSGGGGGGGGTIANGSITDLQIATNAAIAWSKLSKAGALPGDVGAATAAQGAIANSALQPGAIGSTIVAFNDARLSDARPPTAHTQAFNTITGKPTTLLGYGISDAASAAQGALAQTALQPGAIGSTVQAFSGELVTIAALTPSSGQFLRRGASAWLSAALIAADIPNLDTAKVTTGIFDNNRINWASPAAYGSITPNAVSATTINASAATASTSTTTGAIVTPGGGGFGGSLFLGGGVNAISAALRSGSFTSTIVPATLSANQNIIIPNNSGTIALLSDIAAATGVQKLYVNNVASTVLTGTLAETTFLTFTIPGNTVGANSCLDIEELVGGITNNANVKTLRVKIGANAVIAAPVTNFASFGARRTLRCQNSQSSQVIYALTSIASSGGTTLNATVFTIDFTVDQIVTVTGQLTVATDSMQLRGTTVFLY